MSITSAGYDGSVNEANWATMSNLVGTDYSVAGDGDWKVTIGGTGTRAVTVAAGTAFGSGVKDVNSANNNATPAALSSGTRWDTVVIARDWSTNTTVVAIRTGTSTKQVTRTNTTPGVVDDQPIALIFLDSTLSAVQQLIDLRSQTGKIHTVATAAGLTFLPVQVGAWAYALDTGHRWHGELVSSTPTWVDKDAPMWTNITLPSTASPSSPVPAYSRIGGVVYIRGVWVPQGFPTYLTGGGSGPGYSLGNLPAGYRPGANTSFPADHGFNSTSNAVRIRISTTGIIQADILGDTSAIGAGTISFPAEN